MMEPARPVTNPASYLNVERPMSKSEPWRLEPIWYVSKPVEPRNFRPARPANDLNVEGSMSKSEPWRLVSSRPAQHASFQSVLGPERNQPIRSRPAQPATCSSAQIPRRAESGRHLTYPTWSHMELVRENEPAGPVTWPYTHETGSVKPAGPVHWSGIEVSQPTRYEPARPMTHMNEKKSVSWK